MWYLRHTNALLKRWKQIPNASSLVSTLGFISQFWASFQVNRSSSFSVFNDKRFGQPDTISFWCQSNLLFYYRKKNTICYSFETKPFSLIHCAIYCNQFKALASDSRLIKITAAEFAVSEVRGLKLQSAKQYFVLTLLFALK